jgi:hypothetical protein
MLGLAGKCRKLASRSALLGDGEVEWAHPSGARQLAGEQDATKDVKGLTMAKNTICLWYDKDAETAAHFYAKTFPDSAVGAVHRAPSDYPFGRKGDVLTVEFTVAGIPCLGLNGGPAFKHNDAAGGHEARRAFEAMMGMKKIDVAAIEAARRG